MKYDPSFPDHFGSIQDSRCFCGPYFIWYNSEHRHSSLALLTPADVHYGRAEAILEQRRQALLAAFEAHPERFKGRRPTIGQLPEAVWINPPEESS